MSTIQLMALRCVSRPIHLGLQSKLYGKDRSLFVHQVIVIVHYAGKRCVSKYLI